MLIVLIFQLAGEQNLWHLTGLSSNWALLTTDANDSSIHPYLQQASSWVSRYTPKENNTFSTWMSLKSSVKTQTFPPNFLLQCFMSGDGPAMHPGCLRKGSLHHLQNHARSTVDSAPNHLMPSSPHGHHHLLSIPTPSWLTSVRTILLPWNPLLTLESFKY